MSTKCEALLDVALNSEHNYDRDHAIDMLAELGCHRELGIVAKSSKYNYDRQHAMDKLREIP